VQLLVADFELVQVLVLAQVLAQVLELSLAEQELAKALPVLVEAPQQLVPPEPELEQLALLLIALMEQLRGLVLLLELVLI
jgi:hypothetical protein